MASFELTERSLPSLASEEPQTGLGDADSPTSLSVNALAPVDGGVAAWTFLVGATLVEFLAWGLPFSVGVLHSYWTTTLFPPETPGAELLSLAATLPVRSMPPPGAESLR